MIACASNKILMGKQSSLGPIDPQFGGTPVHGVLEEFDRAIHEIKEDPDKIPLWQAIVAKYSPSLLGECKKAVDWSTEITADWLQSGMFSEYEDGAEKAEQVVEELADHALTKSHARHLPIDRCRDIRLDVDALEDD